MKISDACVELLSKNPQLYFPFSEDEEKIIIIPYLDHYFCHAVLKYANKRDSKHSGWFKRELECKRVANALEQDYRFEKFIHSTGRRAYIYFRGK